eukprot:6363720-Prymnesium_polylepis.1
MCIRDRLFAARAQLVVDCGPGVCAGVRRVGSAVEGPRGQLHGSHRVGGAKCQRQRGGGGAAGGGAEGGGKESGGGAEGGGGGVGGVVAA